MSTTQTLSITAADALTGDVILDGPHGAEREITLACRPEWLDFVEPVRSLVHFEGEREMDFYYALDQRLTVRRTVAS